jgi:hypothetical protein
MQASTELMSESIKFLPQDVTQALQLQADLMNIPKIGSDKNFLCHSMQVNVSPAKAAGDSEHHITRSLDIVPALWTAASLTWPRLTLSTPIPFQEFYHWLAKATHQKEPDGIRRAGSLKQKPFLSLAQHYLIC